MRTIGTLAIAASLALAGPAFPGAARAQEAARDSASAVEVSTTPAPPPLPLDVLRHGLGDGAARLRIGDHLFTVRHASLGPDGLGFEPGDLSGRATPVPGAPYWMEKRPAAPASPIPWERIDRIECRKSSAMRGALVGMLLLPAALVVQLAATDQLDQLSEGDMAGFAQVVVFGGGATVGVAVGALVGSFAHHWKPVWSRPAAGTGGAR